MPTITHGALAGNNNPVTSPTINRYASNNTSVQQISPTIQRYQATVNPVASAKSVSSVSETPSVSSSSKPSTITNAGASASPVVTSSGSAKSYDSDSSEYSNYGIDYDAYIEYAKELDEESRAWSAEQAQITRDFNASEAEKARQFSADQSQITRDFNSSEAQKQRDYETQMSNTSYQRAVADLQAAGLNPVLAAKVAGASTPSGASATSNSASSVSATGVSASGDYNNTSSMISGIVSSAVNASIAGTQRQTALDQIASNKELAYIAGYFNTTTASISAGGMIGAAQINYAASQYTSNNNLYAALNSAEKSLEGVKYSSDNSYNFNLISKSIDLYCKEAYPSSIAGIASSLGQKLLSTVKGEYNTETYAQIIGKLDSKYK